MDSFAPIWEQVDNFRKVIREEMRAAPDGIHLLCFSQGECSQEDHVCTARFFSLPFFFWIESDFFLFSRRFDLSSHTRHDPRPQCPYLHFTGGTSGRTVRRSDKTFSSSSHPRSHQTPLLHFHVILCGLMSRMAQFFNLLQHVFIIIASVWLWFLRKNEKQNASRLIVCPLSETDYLKSIFPELMKETIFQACCNKGRQVSICGYWKGERVGRLFAQGCNPEPLSQVVL